MNSREVIDNLLRNKKSSRMGLYDAPWFDTIEKWVKEGNYPQIDEKSQYRFEESKEETQAENPVDYFGFDMCLVGGWIDILPIPGYSEIIEETDEWEVRKNGAGAVLKYWKNKSGTPEHIDFHMTNRKIWENEYRDYLLELNRERLDIKNTAKELEKRKKQGLWTFYGDLFVWENMRQSMGDTCLYESLLLDPEWIHDYNRVYTDFYKKHYQVLIEEAGKPDGIWIYEDLGYKNGLFCSPEILKELIFPYYKELVDFFHSYDLPVVLHSCGGIKDALPLIVDAGFDGLNPMEVKAGCDVIKFAKKYGDDLAFVGGLDARILESGDRDLIKRSVIELIKGMKEINARFVFGSDHSISTNVAYDDFKYAINIYREHMWY